MKSFIEILKTILPAIITGVFTFFVTKYNYNKNVPLDKMEIAYDKIYYPVYKMITRRTFEHINNIERFIYELSIILDKNHNYADRSTLNSFNLLQKNKNKEAYLNFKNNIINKHLYFRRRLGYLEPNILQVYTYSSKLQKYFLRLSFEIIIFYVAVILFPNFNDNDKAKSILFGISIISGGIIIFESFIMLFHIICFNVKRFFKYIKSRLKK